MVYLRTMPMLTEFRIKPTMNDKPSQEVQIEAMKIAKARQKPGQTKEQTKLIAQGIEKGIADYKKQQNKKARERDKFQKLSKKKLDKQPVSDEDNLVNTSEKRLKSNNNFAWILLILSWLGFVCYFYL